MAQGAVEIWLGELLMQQQASLHTVIRAADIEVNDEEFDLLAFLDKFQAQVNETQPRTDSCPVCLSNRSNYLAQCTLAILKLLYL